MEEYHKNLQMKKYETAAKQLRKVGNNVSCGIYRSNRMLYLQNASFKVAGCTVSIFPTWMKAIYNATTLHSINTDCLHSQYYSAISEGY